MPNFLGIDASLTCTGLGKIIDGTLSTEAVSPPKKMFGIERLAWFEDFFDDLFLLDWHTVAIEGYSFGSKQGREALGELGGLIKLSAWRAKGAKSIVIVPPNTLKKFTTGVGNCPKSVMVKEVYKKWLIDVSNDNEADGAGLAKIAEALLGVIRINKAQAAALAGVESL